MTASGGSGGHVVARYTTVEGQGLASDGRPSTPKALRIVVANFDKELFESVLSG